LTDTIHSFGAGVLWLCQTLMNIVGPVDDFFSKLMFDAGITDPQRQLVIVLCIALVLAVFALGVLRGYVGWLLLLLVLLLVLHRIVPALGEHHMSVPGPLQNSL